MADFSAYFSPSPAPVGGIGSQMPYGGTGGLPPMVSQAGAAAASQHVPTIGLVILVIATFILFHAS